MAVGDQLPRQMRRDFNEALLSPELFTLDRDMAVLASRLESLLDKANGKAGVSWTRLTNTLENARRAAARGDSQRAGRLLAQCLAIVEDGREENLLWHEIRATITDRRRLAGTENVIRATSQTQMRSAEVMKMVNALGISVATHVKDPEILDAIERDFRRIINEAAVREALIAGGDDAPGLSGAEALDDLDPGG